MGLPVLLQSQAGSVAGSSAPTISFLSNTTNGSLILAGAGWNASAVTITNVSDGGDGVGGVFQNAVGPQIRNATNTVAQLQYAQNVTARTTPTVTWSLSAAANLAGVIAEFGTVATASCFEVGTATDASASGTQTGGSINTNTSNDVITGFWWSFGPQGTTGAAWASNASYAIANKVTRAVMTYQVVSATGNYAAEVVIGSATDWAGITAAFRGAPDAAPTFFGFRTMTGVGI